MPTQSEDLHGNAPDTCRTGLLIIDTINAFDFEGAREMLPRALAAAQAIGRLKRRARQAGVPVVYVNDNFGRWRSDFHDVLEHCLRSPGREIAVLLPPDKEDYFVLKPKHSGFQHTSLDVLLEDLGCEKLILVVPRDCIASASEADDRAALEHMAKVTKADTRPAAEIELRC